MSHKFQSQVWQVRVSPLSQCLGQGILPSGPASAFIPLSVDSWFRSQTGFLPITDMVTERTPLHSGSFDKQGMTSHLCLGLHMDLIISLACIAISSRTAWSMWKWVHPKGKEGPEAGKQYSFHYSLIRKDALVIQYSNR